jgi:hypothetical protein
MQQSNDDSPSQKGCPAVENPLTALVRLYEEQLEICGRLESVADSLPADIDVQACGVLAAEIRSSMAFLHRFEEEVFHPLVAERAVDRSKNLQTFERLSDEHFSDQGYAEEIIELLSALRQGSRQIDMERAGYMLRGFFESVRRHTRFELDHVVNQARENLSAEDLKDLGEKLEVHRMMAPVACTVTRVKIRNRRRD